MILKQYRFIVECTYTIEDLTSELVRSSLKGHPDYEDVIEDKETWERADRQRRLLHGLLQDKEVLEKYVRLQLAWQFQDLVSQDIAPQFGLGDVSEETMLLPVIEQMSPEDASSLASLIKNDEFDYAIDLLIDCFNLKLDRTTISEISK